MTTIGVPTHLEALASSLALAELTGKDDAAKRLAIDYANLMDADPDQVPKVGPMYLSALTALGLTPAARKAAMRKEVPDGGDRPGPEDQLARLRAERAAQGSH